MINQNNQSQDSQRDVNAILKAISERLTRQGQQEPGSIKKNSNQRASELSKNSYQSTQQGQEAMMRTQNVQVPQMNAKEEASFDDNFSFEELDFAPAPAQETSNTRNEINNLLRTYNNNKKSSYGQDQSSSETNWGQQESGLNQEWTEEFDLNEQETEQSELRFEDEQDEFDSFENEEEFDSLEDEREEDLDSFQDENEEEMNEFEDFSDFEPESNNVHFLNKDHQQSSAQVESEYEIEEQSYQGEQSSGANNLAMQIEYAVAQAITDCVQEWCQENLESLCREVIQSELRKTA